VYCPKCGSVNADNADFCQSCGSSLKVAPTSAPTGGSTPAGQPWAPVSGFTPTASAFPTKFNIMGTINRAIDLCKNPAAFMGVNRDADPPINTLLIYYVAVLALIPLVGTLLGDLWYYGAYCGVVNGYGYAFVSAILSYILDIVEVFVVGFIAWKLAPSFGTTTTQVRATVLAAYAFTPFFLISVVDIIPPISFLTFLGVLFGLYIVYLGLPILMNAPKDKEISYIIVLIIALVIVGVIINIIVYGIADAAFGLHYGYY